MKGFFEQIALKTPTELENDNFIFPSTRYQGSKSKIVNWIWEEIKHVEFDTVLDAFGGTGAVSHLLKKKNKTVTYNDIMRCNYVIGCALIENDSRILSEEDITFIFTKHPSISYKKIIKENFEGIFFLPHENEWLDVVVQNIHNIEDKYKQSLAWFALFQSCIIKRPYNLFHRSNLSVRTNDVVRNFGNKTTWEKPFEAHFRTFVGEANNAIFSNGRSCCAINCDALEIANTKYDLIYIDTPYINQKGNGTNYYDYYHFLEGMLNYGDWASLVNPKYKHKPIHNPKCDMWTNKKKIYTAFDELFSKYRDSVLAVSYRADGTPSISELVAIMEKYKKKVSTHSNGEYKYALSSKATAEILIIGQ